PTLPSFPTRRSSDLIAELFLEDVALHQVPAGAAPFLRPRGRDPALLGEDPMPAQQVVLGKVRVACDLLLQILRQVRAQPAAHLRSEEHTSELQSLRH